MLVTGENGNSIFLPAAGGWNDTIFDSAGSWGFYKSSSLYVDSSPYAWTFYFSADYRGLDYDYRFYGYTIRPVYVE